jgi:hypothetical protein
MIKYDGAPSGAPITQAWLFEKVATLHYCVVEQFYLESGVVQQPLCKSCFPIAFPARVLLSKGTEDSGPAAMPALPF